MYIPRSITKTYKTALKQFPAVLITGPRQSGKSTFLKTVSSNIPYITFDDPLNREFALNDPNEFLNQFKGNPVILDEIQYVPEILQYIKIRIDNDRKPGGFHPRNYSWSELLKRLLKLMLWSASIVQQPNEDFLSYQSS